MRRGYYGLLLVIGLGILASGCYYAWRQVEHKFLKQLGSTGGMGMPKPPVSGSRSPLLARLAVLSDTQGLHGGNNTPVIREVVERLNQLEPKPGYLVMPGDLVNGSKNLASVRGQLENLHQLMKQLDPSVSILRGIGNHEMLAGPGAMEASAQVFPEQHAHYMEGSSRSVYYVDIGNVRIWMLNTELPGEGGSVSQSQVDFVKQNQSDQTTFNLFFYHRPAFPTGITGLLVNAEKRNKLWKAIEGTRNPLVINGHEHYYTRKHIDHGFDGKVKGVRYSFVKSIYQVTAGGMADHLYRDYSMRKNVDVAPISVNHYVVIDLYRTQVVVRAFSAKGGLLDAFTLERSDRGNGQ